MGTMGFIEEGTTSEGEFVCRTRFFGAVLRVVKKQGRTMRQPDQGSIGPVSSPQKTDLLPPGQCLELNPIRRVDGVEK